MQHLRSVFFVLLVRIIAYGVSGTTNDVIKRTLSAVSSSEFMTRCYEPFGCFSISPPWTSSSRPINHFPQSPRDIAPGYCLYSRKLKGLCTDVTSHELLSASNYNRNLSTIVVTHGYLENGRKKWIKRMVDELLLHHDVNIIVLDWVRGSGPPYTQAVSNIRLIGRMVAHYLLNLSEHFAHSLAEFHFIGHSLGSHLAGYTGETLKEYGVKLGRITGLDPAEPYFQGTEELIRLDPSDAQFVDVIHTDGGPIISGGLGLLQPVGHLDFYPNGGVKQPGCGGSVLDSIEKEKGSLVYGLRRFIGCNHIMAYEFFTESIRPAKCPFLSIECGSSEEFYSGSCTSCGVNGTRCHVMGMKSSLYYSKNNNGKYPEDVPKPVKAFLLTGSEKPFCRFHHRVSVVMSDTGESFDHGGDRGILYLTLTGESGATEVFQLSQQKIYFEPGNVYTFMIGSHYLGNISSGIVEWRYSRSLLNPFTWRIASDPGVFVNRVDVECLETGQRFSLCGHDLMITSGIPVAFLPDTNCRRQELSVGRSSTREKRTFFSFFRG